MKKTLIAAGILISLISIPAHAQTTQDLIAMSRAQVQADRQTIVTATLGLTEAEGKTFWPLYRDYRAEMDKPLDRAWNLLVKYADTWDAMTDADAKTALDEWLSLEKQQSEIKQKWAHKMSSHLRPVTVARFFQIDNKLDSLIRLEAASEIPLVMAKQQ